MDIPWLCGRDFNEILLLSDKINGNDRKALAILNFRLALEDCNLVDLRFISPMMTWIRKRRGNNII